MLRMEIACILILFFIAVIYFTASREKNKMHKIYSAILIILMIHLVFDAITVVTVAHLDTFPRFWNDTLHRIFLSTMLTTIYLYYRYITELIRHERKDEQTGSHKINIVLSKFLDIYYIIAQVLIFITPVTYVVTDKGNYERGIGAAIIYTSVAIFMLHMVVNFLFHWKYIHQKKRIAIVCAFVIEFIVTGLTMIDSSLLLAGMGLTLIAVAFYMVLENPDIKLVELAREEKKKAEEANASKSAFLSVVSHEIRTPMNAIVGMTELLLEEEHDEKSEKYLNNIKTSGDSLLMIVNDLLDQSKIEAGKMEIIEDVYELKPLLEDVRLIVENRIGEKPIKAEIELDEKLPAKLIGDSLRIRQILINLMNNAVKFTEKGFVRLVIAIEKEDTDGYYIKYTVKDSGQGIREEDKKKLFEAFSQVDQQKNHSKEGTGLGLTISKDFIRLMGGKLCVESVYGEGSEFFFTIKQKKAEDDAKTIEEKKKEIQPDEFVAHDAKVLLVDDNIINIQVETIMLEMSGVEVDSAGSGAAALEIIQANEYKMIFMDYMMPYMDGVEATEKLRALADETDDAKKADYYRNVPVIALTGDGMEESKELFRKAGMNDFIEKPVVKTKLNGMLLKWLPDECK